MFLTPRAVVPGAIALSESEMLQVTREYIKLVIGDGCRVDDGHIIHWTRYPHGSGTTTDMGEATHLQVMANAFRLALDEALSGEIK